MGVSAGGADRWSEIDDNGSSVRSTSIGRDKVAERYHRFPARVDVLAPLHETTPIHAEGVIYRKWHVSIIYTSIDREGRVDMNIS